jgi:hypothetical protein
MILNPEIDSMETSASLDLVTPIMVESSAYQDDFSDTANVTMDGDIIWSDGNISLSLEKVFENNFTDNELGQ